ncbi:uncharacterized protein LOC5517165 [Nematostella vectensis]|uniref:uncharacterized protein LOC5517165 n=1 Tax=Nematostella vectensis TaxID=45351 RepID=UPI00207713D6|nr:uncharacterized protein LOC5517165 [Nematostella vectensis]
MSEDVKFSLSSFVQQERKRSHSQSEQETLSSDSAGGSPLQVVFVNDLVAVGDDQEGDDSFGLPDATKYSGEVNPHFNPADQVDGLPVFTRHDRGISLQTTMEICVGNKFDPRYVCDRPPVEINECATFIIDLTKIENKTLGSDADFGRHSSPSRFITARFDSDGSVIDMTTLKSSADAELPPAAGYVNYRLKRQYSWHRWRKGFTRILTRVEKDGKSNRYGVLQYKVPPEEIIVQNGMELSKGRNEISQEKVAKNHGTELTDRRGFSTKSRDNTTSGSNLNLHSGVKELKTVNRRVVPETDTNICTIVTSSEISQPGVGSESSNYAEPHSSSTADSAKADIYNILKGVNSERPKTMESKLLPDTSKLLKLLERGDFMRDVSFSTSVKENGANTLNVRTFAMGEVQKQWLKSFCSGGKPRSCASIKMTCKIGDHFLTTVSCPLPMFVRKDDSSANPRVLLAMMTSMTHDKTDYEYLAINLRRAGVTSMVYGTDYTEGVRGLELGFPVQDTKNIHFYCFDAVRASIENKLGALKMPLPEREVLLKQIFGSGEQDMYCLVSQNTEAAYNTLLSTFQKKWPMAFCTWFSNTDCGKDSIDDTIKRGMIKAVRAKGGLGPAKYSNKHNLTYLDSVISEMSDLRTDIAEIHDLVKSKAVEGQLAEFVKAMYNMGDFRLAEGYKHLGVSFLSM